MYVFITLNLLSYLLKHAVEGKRICSTGARLEDLSVFRQESCRMEEKNNSMQDVRPVISDSRVVSEGSPHREGSHSSMNPSSACGNKSMQNCLVLSSVGVNIIASEPDPINPKSSMGGDQSHDFININELDKISDALVEGGIIDSRINARKRRSSSLITFRRRSKQKSDDNALQPLDTSSLSLPIDGCKSAVEANASQLNCSLQSPENQTPSKKKVSRMHSLTHLKMLVISSEFSFIYFMSWHLLQIICGDVNDSGACTSSVPKLAR